MLLTLDLATHTGWTRGRPEDRHFDFGTHVLPKRAPLGYFLKAYQDWLRTTLEGVSMVMFESPILPRKTSLGTLRRLYGLTGVTEMTCDEEGVHCREANLMSVRAFMSPMIRSKDDVIRCCRRYGFDPQDDNQADAIAVRLYALHLLYPKVHGMNLSLGALGGDVRV